MGSCGVSVLLGPAVRLPSAPPRPVCASACLRPAATSARSAVRPSAANSASKVCAISAPAKEPGIKQAPPALTPELGRELYRDMALGRRFEEMCARMYYNGKMFGFVHLYSGQEAISAGVVKALRKSDYVTSTYRDHVHALSKGVAARKIMAELFGKKTGCCRGQGGSMHLFDKEHNVLGGYAFIGEGIPVAVGAGFTSTYKSRALGEDGELSVSVALFGDGTCNVGQFAESLNMAALYKLPCIFVVENNLWAIGMNHPRATASSLGDMGPEIWKKGPAYGMPGVLVDGMDVLAVRKVAEEAIARARRGDGPTLIEAETYRFRGHSLADPDELRSPAEKEAYVARDPIPGLRDVLLEQGVLSETDIAAMDKEVEEEVEEAVAFAESSAKPEMDQLLENVFADPKGFGIAADGRYRYELPGFTSGTAAVS